MVIGTHSFVSSTLKEAEIDLNKIQITPYQRQMVVDIAKVIHEFIPISELALRGFVLRSVKEFQLKYKITPKEIADRSPLERKEAMKIGFSILEEQLARVLRNQSDRSILKEAMNKAFEYYVDNFLYK